MCGKGKKEKKLKNYYYKRKKLAKKNLQILKIYEKALTFGNI